MRCSILPASLAGCTTEWSRFSQTVDAVLHALLPIHPDTVWPVVGLSGLKIGEVTAGDFAFKLANISWTLVDADFAARNGGVGAVESTFRGGDWLDPNDWMGAAESIQEAAFLSYMQLEGGAYYLVLHETAHTTRLGLQTNNLQFDHYVQRGGDRNDGRAWSQSPEWLYNEQVANAIAAAVARALDVEILAAPTCGYPGSGLPPIRRSIIA